MSRVAAMLYLLALKLKTPFTHLPFSYTNNLEGGKEFHKPSILLAPFTESHSTTTSTTVRVPFCQNNMQNDLQLR